LRRCYYVNTRIYATLKCNSIGLVNRRMRLYPQTGHQIDPQIGPQMDPQIDPRDTHQRVVKTA
jgi:hypothetical protein